MCGCEDNARPKSPGGGRVESLRGALIRGGWRKSSVNIIYYVLLLGGKNRQTSMPPIAMTSFLPSPSNLLSDELC
jgi:hypothetical protein